MNISILLRLRSEVGLLALSYRLTLGIISKRNCHCRMIDDYLEYLLTLTYGRKSRNIASCVTIMVFWLGTTGSQTWGLIHLFSWSCYAITVKGKVAIATSKKHPFLYHAECSQADQAPHDICHLFRKRWRIRWTEAMTTHSAPPCLLSTQCRLPMARGSLVSPGSSWVLPLFKYKIEALATPQHWSSSTYSLLTLPFEVVRLHSYPSYNA